MVFDVTIIVGTNYSLEYDANGGIIEKGDVTTDSFIVPDNKVGKLTVIKDPINDHVNLYGLELYDIPLDIINLFKSNSIKCVIVRLGSGTTKGVKNFDLNKMFIKPIQLIEQSIQNDGFKNDIVIKGISLTANAILMDTSFGTEMADIKNYADAQVLQVNKSNMNVDYTTSSNGVIPKDSPVNVRNYNPGNIISTRINWAGEVDNNGSNFEKFATPELGFRALMLNLKAKVDHGQTTLAEIISVWAPPHENNTGDYQRFMSKSTGLNLNDKVSYSDFANLAKAISWYEGDNKVNFYTDEMINAGAKMAGFDSTVSIKIDKTNSNYAYGTGTPSGITGTNVNRSINIFNNIKGSAILDNVLNRMREKYKIDVAIDAMAGIVKSNFLYKNVSFPGASTLEILKKIHKWYPAYYVEVPWIIDDMRTPQNSGSVGKVWYTEIGLLDIESLPVKSLSSTFDNAGGKQLLYRLFTAEAKRKYYHESPERILAKTVIYKEIPTGIETVFKSESTTELVAVPNVAMDQNGSVAIDKLKINTQSVVNIEAAYTAEEFKKRFDIYKKHVYSNPELIRCHLRCDNPNLIEFGYAYTFSESNLNKITPLKIKMEFKNVENKYQLSYEVDFYKGVNIPQ